MRGPFGAGGFTPRDYAELSDRQILEVYLAERDDDGAVIPEAQLRQRLETGSPENAGRELPSVESLGVPEEALLAGVPTDYTLLFFSIWKGRGLSVDETMAKWREHLKTYRPRGR